MAEAYLTPTLKALFPDPSSFTDMDRAAEVLVDAITSDRPCVVFADYDVDGGSSAALLLTSLRPAPAHSAGGPYHRRKCSVNGFTIPEFVFEREPG